MILVVLSDPLCSHALVPSDFWELQLELKLSTRSVISQRIMVQHFYNFIYTLLRQIQSDKRVNLPFVRAAFYVSLPVFSMYLACALSFSRLSRANDGYFFWSCCP